MKRTLTITIDESGDFGSYQRHSPYYIVGMLFHDPTNDIKEPIQKFDTHIKNLGYDPHILHTGPIIRREGVYENLTLDERRKLLYALVHLNRLIDVQYSVLCIEKRECKNVIDLTAKISKQIRTFVDTHNSYLRSYDKIKVYYDNGQIELTRILTSTLNVLLPHISFDPKMPYDRKLFQLIDMFISFELVALKFYTKTTSKSEFEVFHNHREFKKNYLKNIRKKRL